ncbi:hypothetical protein [Caldimonas brevitalea]|uniref:hypothetical protein n=1 Tax=Caldimonas brevitalea TaxID=413882 RepID=UPI0006400009|nr:hypothetical protein [Caldimonas brevitalea]
MQELSYKLVTSQSVDRSYCFVDELVLSVYANSFGASDVTSEAKLVLSEADRLLKRLDLQLQHLQFSESILGGKSDAELFSTLHQACWETGEWPAIYTRGDAPDPTTYIGLPMATEIFDGEELYAVLQQQDLRLIFKGRSDASPRSTVVDYGSYCGTWRKIREDLAEKIAQTAARN